MSFRIVKCGREGCDGVVTYDEETKEYACDKCGALHESSSDAKLPARTIERAKIEDIIANLREAAETLQAVATGLEQGLLNKPSERTKS